MSMQELFGGMRSLADIDEDARMGEWGEGISYAYRNINIFTALSSRLKREVVEDPTFSFYEGSAPPMRVLKDGTEADTAETSLVVKSSQYTAPAKMMRKGMVLRVGSSPVAGELLFVTDNPTTDDTITVRRGAFGSTAATITDEDEITIMGTASPDGAGAPSPVGIEPYTVENQVQIFRNSYSIDATLDATKTKWGIKERLRRKTNALEQHLLSREMTCLMGEGYEEVDSEEGTPLRTTKGVIPHIVTNRLSAGSTSFTYAAFKAWALPLAKYGQVELTMLLGATLFASIQDMCEDNSQTTIEPGIRKFGMYITRLQTAGPVINLVIHPLLTQYYPGTGVALDLSQIEIKTMRDKDGVRDMRFRPNIQAPDVDGHMGEYLSHIGIALGHEDRHGVIHDNTVYTPAA